MGSQEREISRRPCSAKHKQAWENPKLDQAHIESRQRQRCVATSPHHPAVGTGPEPEPAVGTPQCDRNDYS